MSELAVALGAVAQFRIMGSAVGVALTTSVFNNYVKHHLAGFLNPKQIQELLQVTQTIENFDPMVQNDIKEVFLRGYNIQLRIVAGICGAQLVSTALICKRKNVIVV